MGLRPLGVTGNDVLRGFMSIGVAQGLFDARSEILPDLVLRD